MPTYYGDLNSEEVKLWMQIRASHHKVPGLKVTVPCFNLADSFVTDLSIRPEQSSWIVDDPAFALPVAMQIVQQLEAKEIAMFERYRNSAVEQATWRVFRVGGGRFTSRDEPDHVGLFRCIAWILQQAPELDQPLQEEANDPEA